MNHFKLHAASKLKFLIFHAHTASRKIKEKRMSYTNKKRETEKLRIQADVFADVSVLVA